MSISKPSRHRQRPYETVRFSHEDGATGSGIFRSRPLRKGLVVSYTRPNPEELLRAAFDMEEAPVQFGFTRSGRSRFHYTSGKLRNQQQETQPGSNGIFHLPETRGTIEQCPNDPAQVLGIIASPELLADYFHDDMGRLPTALRATLEGSSATPMTWFGNDSPTKQGLLRQIMNCPYTGGVGRLYVESRVMELLALQIHECIESESPSIRRTTLLSPNDVERIHHARNILVNDLENPPTLACLARTAGINERKLKNGFRQVYGTSVFGYFREHRMQEAYGMLRDGNRNVTEAAFAVGYQSLSHFSRAFRKRFGLLPGKFLSDNRRSPQL